MLAPHAIVTDCARPDAAREPIGALHVGGESRGVQPEERVVGKLATASASRIAVSFFEPAEVVHLCLSSGVRPFCMSRDRLSHAMCAGDLQEQ
jgi:hypothetical protein